MVEEFPPEQRANQIEADQTDQRLKKKKKKNSSTSFSDEEDAHRLSGEGEEGEEDDRQFGVGKLRADSAQQGHDRARLKGTEIDVDRFEKGRTDCAERDVRRAGDQFEDVAQPRRGDATGEKQS